MSTILTNVGSVITAAIGWMGDFVDFITSSGNEIILLFIIIPFVGLAIGLIKRLISL